MQNKHYKYTVFLEAVHIWTKQKRNTEYTKNT